MLVKPVPLRWKLMISNQGSYQRAEYRPEQNCKQNRLIKLNGARARKLDNQDYATKD